MGLFSTAPTVLVQVERPDGIYYAGDTVKAAITVAAEDEASHRGIIAGLLLKERYSELHREYNASSRSSSTVARWIESDQWFSKEQIAPEGTLPAGFRQTYYYEWRLPDNALGTYNGEIAQLKWLVSANIDRKLAKDPHHEVQLGVITPPPFLLTQPTELVESNSHPAAANIRFILPKTTFVQGETITGRVLITPIESIEPRGVQVELVRNEVVPGGYRQHIKKKVEQTVQIAPKIQLTPGTTVPLDFTVTVPASWCPTYQAGHSYAVWQLVATLDIPWGKDYVATQSVSVFNGMARQAAPEAAAQNAYQQGPIPGNGAAEPSMESPKPHDMPVSVDGIPAVSTFQPEESAVAPGPRFCGSCGSHLPELGRFCSKCGKPVAVS